MLLNKETICCIVARYRGGIKDVFLKHESSARSQVDFNQLDPVDGSHFGRPWCQRHGSGRMCLVFWTYLEPQGAVSLALTLLGGVRFIAWRLRHHLLGECRRGPSHFWECRTRLGYGPAPRPTLKRPCATLVRLVGRPTNTVLQDLGQ